MKLIFKQKLLSWFDSYDVYNAVDNSVAFTVKGQLSWGHSFKIFDSNGFEVATIRQKIFTFLPKFELYLDNRYIGCISREISFFRPKYNIDFNGWHIEGNFFEWDYQIINSNGVQIATISKELFNWTDTYSIDVYNTNDALYALMLVVAIDAEKCSRNNS